MTKLMSGLHRWSRALVRHLPEKPYPSDHPWRDHHDPSPPAWVATAPSGARGAGRDRTFDRGIMSPLL